MLTDKKCSNCEHCSIAGDDMFCNEICEPVSPFYEACEDGQIKIPDGTTMLRKIYNMCQARIDIGHHDGRGYREVQDYIRYIICEPYEIKIKEE